MSERSCSADARLRVRYASSPYEETSVRPWQLMRWPTRRQGTVKRDTQRNSGLIVVGIDNSAGPRRRSVSRSTRRRCGRQRCGSSIHGNTASSVPAGSRASPGRRRRSRRPAPHRRGRTRRHVAGGRARYQRCGNRAPSCRGCRRAGTRRRVSRRRPAGRRVARARLCRAIAWIGQRAVRSACSLSGRDRARDQGGGAGAASNAPSGGSTCPATACRLCLSSSGSAGSSSRCSPIYLRWCTSQGNTVPPE